MKVSGFIWLIFLFFSFSCNNSTDRSVIHQKRGKNELEDINRYFVQKDRESIQNYIERKNLSMSESSTGLWYYIRKEGTGSFFTDNVKVSIDYKCSLLDGTECYNSEIHGPKDYILGKSGIEAGLNEGLRMLKPGGEAMFIIPPFLGFGLLGDGKSIPSRAILVYDIKIRSGN
jgi:FKBP-type peptidyl-prolyl cis-trans isomerase FkpA